MLELMLASELLPKPMLLLEPGLKWLDQSIGQLLQFEQHQLKQRHRLLEPLLLLGQLE